MYQVRGMDEIPSLSSEQAAQSQPISRDRHASLATGIAALPSVTRKDYHYKKSSLSPFLISVKRIKLNHA